MLVKAYTGITTLPSLPSLPFICRCPLITPEDQICENLATIFLSIIDEFGHAYMVKCLEVSIDALTLPQENNQNIKDSLSSASMKNFLEGSILINSNIVQLQNKFFKEIWPEMERRGDRFSQKKCLDAKAILMNKLEDLIITGLSKVKGTRVNQTITHTSPFRPYLQ